MPNIGWSLHGLPKRLVLGGKLTELMVLIAFPVFQHPAVVGELRPYPLYNLYYSRIDVNTQWFSAKMLAWHGTQREGRSVHMIFQNNDADDGRETYTTIAEQVRISVNTYIYQMEASMNRALLKA